MNIEDFSTLEEKAKCQLETNARSFKFKGVSHKAAQKGRIVKIYAPGRGGMRVIHTFDMEENE